jgi:hypothetical protein
MNNNGQSAGEEVRVILLRPDSDDILVSREPGARILPRIDIPAHSRHAEEVTSACARFHHLETYCLFTLPADTQPVPAHHYSFSCLSIEDSEPPAGFHWIGSDSLAEEHFADRRDFHALKTGCETIQKCRRDPQAGYFGRPGWLAEMTEWVRAQIAGHGLRLTGECSQWNASATTSLLRFETDASAVWFKAVGEPNLQEFPITRYLAEYLPEFVPKILAAHDESNGWLSEETAGCHLDGSSDDAAWIAVAGALARLQRRTMGHTLHLAEAGCVDVRAHALAETVQPFLDVMAGLMDEQTKTSPAPLTGAELQSLGGILLDAISSVDALDFPSVLGHLDFNLGNILACPGRIVFLDWAAAAVGNPLFTFEYLLEQQRTVRPMDHALQTELCLAYARNWLSFVDADDFALALAAAPLLAAFGYATSGGAWCDPARRSSPATAGHLRSMTRRMKREAGLWASRTRSAAAYPRAR